MLRALKREVIGVMGICKKARDLLKSTSFASALKPNRKKTIDFIALLIIYRMSPKLYFVR